MLSSLGSRSNLAPELEICRVLIGMWQVSGEHGDIDCTRAIESMIAHCRAGFTSFDLADHYGPAEDLIGALTRHPEWPSTHFQALTKWVPEPQPMDRGLVELAVDRARRRMGCAALDLLQLHWWDYEDARPLTGLRHLMDLKQEGKVRHLGLTNVDGDHLQRIIDADIRVVSNQVQYSVLDMRPARRMAALCQEHDVQLLAYGTLCGGFLSARYRGLPDPPFYQLGSASLRKYKKIIDAWGGWALFQELLDVLTVIAAEHDASLAQVAVAFILERTAVAGVILGCRLGTSEHMADNARALELRLTDADRERISAVQARANDLYSIIGDCGDEYRRGAWWGSR